MNILIANPGSTSYKCKLFRMPEEEVIFQATVDRIGETASRYWSCFSSRDPIERVLEVQNTLQAVQLTLETLQQRYSLHEIAAIGFKTVHARGVSGCVGLSSRVLQAMEDYRVLAPVHTRVYVEAISAFHRLLPEVPRIGLFETAFHCTIPPEAYLYGIPYEYYQKYGIRKYGFHGASHRYVAERSAELFAAGTGDFRVISCHLGGSSSVCAIRNEVSVDISMGMSPQSGVINAQRVGDLDPFALLYLLEQEKLTPAGIRNILITRSGIQGIDGHSGDLREVISRMDKGDERSYLAFQAFAYSVKRYIGEYLAVLNGADVIVFTGGAGQYSPRVRQEIVAGMENLGIVLDEVRNRSNPVEGLISAENSRVKIAVIPTNEELIVVREVEKFLNEPQPDERG